MEPQQCHQEGQSVFTAELQALGTVPSTQQVCPRKVWLGRKGINECPNPVSPLCIAGNSHQIRPHQLVAALVLDLRSPLSLRSFHLRIPSSLPSGNMLYIDCTRVSLGDETIRMNDPVLTHRVVDKHIEYSSSLARSCERYPRGSLPVQRRKCCQPFCPFSQLGICKGNIFPLLKQDQERFCSDWLKLVPYLVLRLTL